MAKEEKKLENKGAFFGREIPDEANMREEFEIKRDRYQVNKPKYRAGGEEEDELDDLINEKQSAIDADIRREAERLAEKFDELDFDDIDAILGSVE